MCNKLYSYKKIVVHITILMVLLIFLGLHAAGCQVDKDKNDMKKKINSIFTDFENEKFVEYDRIVLESGWMMTLPSGREVTRSFLQEQAEQVILLGEEATPYLFDWVMNDNLAVRYIAVWSLQQITGLSPHISHFDKEDSIGNREKATGIWNEWWKKQK